MSDSLFLTNFFLSTALYLETFGSNITTVKLCLIFAVGISVLYYNLGRFLRFSSIFSWHSGLYHILKERTLAAFSPVVYDK